MCQHLVRKNQVCVDVYQGEEIGVSWNATEEDVEPPSKGMGTRGPKLVVETGMILTRAWKKKCGDCGSQKD